MTRARTNNDDYVRGTTTRIIHCWRIIETRKALLHPLRHLLHRYPHTHVRDDQTTRNRETRKETGVGERAFMFYQQ